MARLVVEKEAADAVGIDLATFRGWVACNRLLQAFPECGKRFIIEMSRWPNSPPDKAAQCVSIETL
jgi:hypothetical protein